MSNNPNDPFGGNPNSPGSTAAGQMPAGPPAKKSKGPVFWIVGCLGGAAILGLACCGGMAVLTQFGMSQVAGQLQQQIEGSPVIAEHIGEIQTLKMSWGETMANAQNQGGGAEELAFEIVGTKGSGTLYAQKDQASAADQLTSARLVTSDGQSFPVDMGFAPEVNLDDMFDAGETMEELEPAEMNE